jgi:hypothetical protein
VNAQIHFMLSNRNSLNLKPIQHNKNIISEIHTKNHPLLLISLYFQEYTKKDSIVTVAGFGNSGYTIIPSSGRRSTSEYMYL